jgi:hypothetical protein
MDAINKCIEKIIELRIDDIVQKSNLGLEVENEIKNTNKNILIEQKKSIKKKQKYDSKIRKYLTGYTAYVKDVSQIVKDEPTLNYLPNNIINHIKTLKSKKANDQFKEFGILWNELDDDIKNKYKKICKDKDFTKDKYEDIVKKNKR